jgi:hypothetical protein
MRKLRQALLMSLLSIGTANAQFAGANGDAAPASTGDSRSVPSMAFASTIAADEIYDALKKSPALASLDKDKPGSPIAIRVSLEYGRNSSASNLASAVFAIGTLGLLPVVSNRDLLITYDVLVNETVMSSYSYSKKVTHVFNMYSTDKTHGLGADGLAWVIASADEFAADLARDQKYADLQAEYRYYYASPAAALAH